MHLYDSIHIGAYTHNNNNACYAYDHFVLDASLTEVSGKRHYILLKNI